MLSILLMAAALTAGEPDCAAIERSVGEPLAIETVAIMPRALFSEASAETDTKDGAVMTGRFEYRGNGISVRSSDPRFADIIVDHARGEVHRCGQGIWRIGSVGASAPNRKGPSIRLRPLSDGATLGSGAMVAAQRGTIPVLAGSRLLASWPAGVGHEEIFIGIMGPVVGPQKHSDIVAFADVAGPTPAVRLARLDRAFQALGVLPALHVPCSPSAPMAQI
ncbi:hypothetical protein G432_00095 [Sphingomonas sp. MM-1]|nr:hypothetical protein G432_00095 [Sphingomonas sp. MM-1]